MINSLTNHMELFEFTFWNKSQILQTWKETEIRSIESLRAPFTPDQPLGARLQLQLHILCSCSPKATAQQTPPSSLIIDGCL